MAPDIFLFGASPVRQRALQAIFPKVQNYKTPSKSAAVLLCDGAWPETVPPDWLVFLLAAARPRDVPDTVHWLATPLSPNTLAQQIDLAWAERPRMLAGHRLHQQPGIWQAPDQPPIILTDKEAQLLATLIDTPRGLPREALLEHLWSMDATRVDTHALETQLYRLRQKLQPAFAEGWFLGLKDGICLLQPPA